MPNQTKTTPTTATRRPCADVMPLVAPWKSAIATGQKADPHPIPPEESILRALFEEENKRQSSN